MKLIINRIDEWFDTDYPELDIFCMCEVARKIKHERDKRNSL